MDDRDDKVVQLHPPKKERKKRAKDPKNYRPASGIPASGIPAGGPGWGGEAKGKGQGPEALIENHSALPEVRAKMPTKEERLALAEEALDAMVHIMRNTTYEALKLAAAEKVRNQIVGTPVQRNIIDDRTDDAPVELVAVWPRQAGDD